MAHSNQPHPSSEPNVRRRAFLEIAASEIRRGTVNRADDAGEAEDPDSEETPPMPRPAVRIGERGTEGNR